MLRKEGARGSRQYATSRKIAGSFPDEVIGFISTYLILPVAI
jgi:hypothetical protein